MMNTEKLKAIFLFQDLPEPELQKIAAVAEIRDVEPETVLFRQGEPLETFYMLQAGKVFLNCRTDSGLVLTLSEVGPGCSFGVSSFIAGTEGSATAICVQPSRVIALSGKVLWGLFQEDSHLGYTIMRRVVQLFKARMNQRTEQFLRSLAHHPDILACLQGEAESTGPAQSW